MAAIGLPETGRSKLPLGAFYEGVGFSDSHPSFSVVALVTVIEQIGAYIFGEDDPPNATPAACGNTIHAESSSKKH